MSALSSSGPFFHASLSRSPSMLHRSTSVLLTAALLGACATETLHVETSGSSASSQAWEQPCADDDEGRALESAVVDLYAAFNFDPGTLPDWARMRALFAEGAVFAYPIAPGDSVELLDADGFLAAFEGWAASPAMQADGFHERILHVETRRVGRVAQTSVLFEGFVPDPDAVGEIAAASRGIDQIQWALDAGTWRLVAFTSQYTEEGLSF